VRQNPAAPGIELRKHVVQQKQRPRPTLLLKQLGLSEQKREDGKPLLTLRPERAQVARARQYRDVVEMRPEARRAALEVALGRSLEILYRRRFGPVAQLGAGQPELLGPLAKARP